jgi:hypothetical protein
MLIASAVRGYFAVPACPWLRCSKTLKTARLSRTFWIGFPVSPHSRPVACWNMRPDLWKSRECESCSTRGPWLRFVAISGHQVSTAFELNWGTLKNGDLLSEAETAGFEVLVTTDQNFRYQQNLSKRRIALVVIGTTSWPRIKNRVAAVIDAINGIEAGGYVEVSVP